MSLQFALDRLDLLGWIPVAGGCERLPNGRPFPTVEHVRERFLSEGSTLEVTHSPQFSCHRASWTGGSIDPGTSVGMSAEEAAAHALAQLLEQTAIPA